jgi:hypothetical protein
MTEIIESKARLFALFSCFFKGEPCSVSLRSRWARNRGLVQAGSAIIAVNRDGEDYVFTPLFVGITAGMILTDHDGSDPGA